MKRISIILALVIMILPVSAFAFGGCESDCMKCHSLSVPEVQLILTKLQATQASIKSIQVSPVKGLWEVLLEEGSKVGVIYVGFSKNHVMPGPVFEIGETVTNKTLQTLEKGVPAAAKPVEPKSVDLSKIPLDNALLLGKNDAKYKVVVFTDPDCPFCGRLHEEIKKIVSERLDIAFYMKLMPLSFHPDAFWKSQSILCSNSLQLLEDNFAKKVIPKPDCDNKAQIEANIKLASELGITGTPTMIMPDGSIIVGARDSKAIVDLVLQQAKK